MWHRLIEVIKSYLLKLEKGIRLHFTQEHNSVLAGSFLFLKQKTAWTLNHEKHLPKNVKK